MFELCAQFQATAAAATTTATTTTTTGFKYLLHSVITAFKCLTLLRHCCLGVCVFLFWLDFGSCSRHVLALVLGATNPPMASPGNRPTSVMLHDKYTEIYCLPQWRFMPHPATAPTPPCPCPCPRLLSQLLTSSIANTCATGRQARDSSVWQVQSLFEEAVAADNALYKLPRKLAVCLPHCLPVCLAVCLFLLLSAQLSRVCHYSLKASTNLPKLSSSW